MTPNERALKARVARKALSFIQSGMRLGLGTGSTVRFFLEVLAHALRTGALKDIVGVPTSEGTRGLCQEWGIPLKGLEEIYPPDLTIDGTDLFAPDFTLVKGRGGALLREKIVAESSSRILIMADITKRRERIEGCHLPVEITPFGFEVTVKRVSALLQERDQSPHSALAGDSTLLENVPISDNGNPIASFWWGTFQEPREVAAALGGIAGVVEHGLFFLPRAQSQILIAHHDHVESLIG